MIESGPARTAVRVPLECGFAPEQAALTVRHDRFPFALVGRWAGGGALIGSQPVRVATCDEDPFALLDRQPAVEGEADGAVGGGWFGYLGYELGRRIEALDPSPAAGARLPPFQLAFYDHLLRLDAGGQWWFEALWSDARAPALCARLHAFRERLATGPSARAFTTAPWRSTPTAAGHRLAVAACRERIAAGDLFQANVCVRLDSRLDGSPIDLFAAAVGQLRPDRAAFLEGPWGAVASLSPELFLERRGRHVRSAPIKGTRPRPVEAAAARRERAALEASAKDRAENTMIVDLVRNDLGRVCTPGSISVDQLATARAHVGVWHLVSEVSGHLRDGVGDGDLIRAAFPPGSVTGAPKVAALNVIAELESSARSVYTGAIGFASPVAGLELSVAIRTFEFTGEHAWLGVGGGIVADSDSAAEALECATKATPLLAAIGGRLATDGAATTATPRPARVGPKPVARPDPAHGVFETLLVSDGRPLWLSEHLLRLARSVRELYGASLPHGLPDELMARAADTPAPARMRVNARPRARGLDIEVELTALAARKLPVRLYPVTVPGGLGPHKWIDRRLLDCLTTVDCQPLLCDLDGFVLETARANVFAVLGDDMIVTPPDDGRILPGITRGRVLELVLETAVRPLHLGELDTASELFVTGALGGVEPACLADRPPAPSPIANRLAARLRDAEPALA
jgi:para-aminobenzoate synthetase / 4-amino-4-deoxychorismate lyase